MTHTNPASTDPVAAMTKYSGATEAHSVMHGRTLMLGTNVLEHGADPTGTSDSAAAFQAAADAVASGATLRERTVWIPGGDYKFADGTGVTCNYDGVRFLGIGTGSGSGASITVKNAYAFTGTNRSGVIFENLYISLRTGSTTGGGFNFTGGNTNTWRHVNVNGVSGSTGVSLFKRTNTVSDVWDHCSATGPAAYGYDLQASTGFMNLIELRSCRAAATSTAGMYINGGKGSLVKNCDFETNFGYGLYLSAHGETSVEGGWWEDNYKDNIRIDSSSDIHIVGARLFANHSAGSGGDATANHITLTGTMYFPTIQSCWATDAANNKTLSIGANVDGTTVITCRGFGSSLVTDSGTATRFINSGSGPLSTVESGFRFGLTRGVFSGAGSPESNVTADIGSIYLRTDGSTSTTLYVKQASNGANTGWKAAFAAAPTSGYTVTNPTTDRALNVTADTTAQVAQVLGTLIADLQAQGLLT